MRSKLIFPVLLGIFLAAVASANSACTMESLASYISLGSGGCTIGADTFASFRIVSPGTAGATAIDPSTVTVTPSGGTTDPTLTFTTSLTATTPELLEALFNYTVAGANFTSDTLTLSGSSETVDGAVTDVQNYCVGGNFGSDGVDGCPGSAGSHLTLDGAINSDQVTIAGTTLGITDDITLDGGTAGTASGGTFVDQYTATANISSTPEPAAFLLTALGLSLAALRKIRRDRHA